MLERCEQVIHLLDAPSSDFPGLVRYDQDGLADVESCDDRIGNPAGRKHENQGVQGHLQAEEHRAGGQDKHVDDQGGQSEPERKTFVQVYGKDIHTAGRTLGSEYHPAAHAADVIKKLLPLQDSDVININIPRLSLGGPPKGIKVLPQATAGFHESYVVRNNLHGQKIYQLTGGDHRDDNSVLTDTIALVEGYITVTALKFGMTNDEKNEELKKRLTE